MVSALIFGFIIGVALAVAPGPVAVTAMRLALDKGLKHAVLSALGTGFMDMVYCLAAIFTTSAALSAIGTLSSGHPMLTLALQMGVVIIILVYGILQLKPRKDTSLNPEAFTKKSNFLSELATKGPFLLGITVSIANVVSPTFLPTLAYITMNVHRLNLIENTVLNNFIFCIGFGLGNFSWIYLLVKVLLHYKSRMSVSFLDKIYKFAGITLIGFGTILGYRIVMITKWSEVLRIVFAF